MWGPAEVGTACKTALPTTGTFPAFASLGCRGDAGASWWRGRERLTVTQRLWEAGVQLHGLHGRFGAGECVGPEAVGVWWCDGQPG